MPPSRSAGKNLKWVGVMSAGVEKVLFPADGTADRILDHVPGHIGGMTDTVDDGARHAEAGGADAIIGDEKCGTGFSPKLRKRQSKH